MTEVQEEVGLLFEQTGFLLDEVASLDDAQVPQDERILTREQEASGKT